MTRLPRSRKSRDALHRHTNNNDTLTYIVRVLGTEDYAVCDAVVSRCHYPSTEAGRAELAAETVVLGLTWQHRTTLRSVRALGRTQHMATY